MKQKSLAQNLSNLVAAALLMTTGLASAADVRVMISAGFHGVYAELAPAFERASGHRLITTRGPSMGDSSEAISNGLAWGEAADVVILDRVSVVPLIQQGLVRTGATKPDISRVDALRSTLLAAKSIAYSDSGSGTYLSTTLFPQLGIAEQIGGKTRKVRGPPSGEPVAAVVARGEAEIAFQQVVELIHVSGISFVGPIPTAVQPTTFFSAALMQTAVQTEAAMALIRYLSLSPGLPYASHGLMTVTLVAS